MTSLRDKLIQNRTIRGSGSGKAYWDSVMEIVERHYNGDQSKVVSKETICTDGSFDPRPPQEAFKEDLEVELDEIFPKGACKHRGAGLVLFAHANILFAKHLKRALKKHE